MESPSPFYTNPMPRASVADRWRHARLRFGRLNRTKQGVLIMLGVLGALIVTATVGYAVTPDDLPLTPMGSAANPTMTPTDSFAGVYALMQGSSQAQILTLNQFRTGLTGQLVTLTCQAGVAHATSEIATGAITPDGALQLTLTSPDLPHSTHLSYRVLHDATSPALIWQDPAHPAQEQAWTRLTQSAQQFAATWCQG